MPRSAASDVPRRGSEHGGGGSGTLRFAMSIAQRDYVLRLIQQLGDFLSRIAGRRREGELDEALREVERALDAIFGPMKRTLNDVDSATAANLLGNADKTLAYAKLLGAQAEVYDDKGEKLVARVARRRSLELLLEARSRFELPRPEVDEAIAALEPQVNLERMSPRHRALLRGETP